MGYWDAEVSGQSFSKGGLIWGDQPADVMDDALDEVKRVFKSDIGREPTAKELLGGLLFSIGPDLDSQGAFISVGHGGTSVHIVFEE